LGCSVGRRGALDAAPDPGLHLLAALLHCRLDRWRSQGIDIVGEVSLIQVSKQYAGGAAAVDSVSLTIPDHEFLVLLGPSGCGKSTLLKMIAGLEEVTHGEIYIDGKLVNYVKPGDRNVAMVF